MHAKPVLLVHDHKAEFVVTDVFLKQRVRTDKNINASLRQPRQYFGPGFAFGLAGQKRRRNADILAHRCNRFKMLFGQNLGRRHNGGLQSAFNRIQHCQKCHNRFAGADIALQQPQHAERLGLVGINFGQHVFLRACQGKGQFFQNLFAQKPVAADNPPVLFFDAFAGNGQRQLISQKFVISQSCPLFGIRLKILLIMRMMSFEQRRAEIVPAVLFDKGRVKPFGQGGYPCQCLFGIFVKHFVADAGRQRINRFKCRNFVAFGFRHDVVRVCHLQHAVKTFKFAADNPHRADGQILGNRISINLKENQSQIFAAVADEHPVGLLPCFRRNMFNNLNPHGANPARHGVFKPRPVRAIDNSRRQMKRQINNFAAAQKILQQFNGLAADAFQHRNIGKQGKQNLRTHKTVAFREIKLA